MAAVVDRRVFRDLSYGLYILSSTNGERNNGQIINTAVQVTSDPPRVAVIVNKDNLTHEYIAGSGLLGLSVLDQSTPMTFIGLFGFRSGRVVDKFAKTEFRKGVTGCPLVTRHALSMLEAEVVSKTDIGSHTIFVGTVIKSEMLHAGEPLTYHYYHLVLKGKSPPAAPTFEPAALSLPGE